MVFELDPELPSRAARVMVVGARVSWELVQSHRVPGTAQPGPTHLQYQAAGGWMCLVSSPRGASQSQPEGQSSRSCLGLCSAPWLLRWLRALSQACARPSPEDAEPAPQQHSRAEPLMGCRHTGSSPHAPAVGLPGPSLPLGRTEVVGRSAWRTQREPMGVGRRHAPCRRSLCWPWRLAGWSVVWSDERKPLWGILGSWVLASAGPEPLDRVGGRAPSLGLRPVAVHSGSPDPRGPVLV